MSLAILQIATEKHSETHEEEDARQIQGLVFRKNELPYSLFALVAPFRNESEGGLSFQSFTEH